MPNLRIYSLKLSFWKYLRKFNNSKILWPPCLKYFLNKFRYIQMIKCFEAIIKSFFEKDSKPNRTISVSLTFFVYNFLNGLIKNIIKSLISTSQHGKIQLYFVNWSTRPAMKINISLLTINFVNFKNFLVCHICK